MLAAVEDVDARESTEVERACTRIAAPCGRATGAQRHVFEERPVGGGAAAKEFRFGPERMLARVVVVDLVIVKRHQPRNGGVQTLEIRIRPVERVAVAVLRKAPGLGAGVAADPAGAARPFVDVVAEEDHQVGSLVGDVAVRPVEAELEVLAGTEREAQQRRRCRALRRGARPADRAALALAMKR